VRERESEREREGERPCLFVEKLMNSYLVERQELFSFFFFLFFLTELSRKKN
jgi:hypothetical protein